MMQLRMSFLKWERFTLFHILHLTGGFISYISFILHRFKFAILSYFIFSVSSVRPSVRRTKEAPHLNCGLIFQFPQITQQLRTWVLESLPLSSFLPLSNAIYAPSEPQFPHLQTGVANSHLQLEGTGKKILSTGPDLWSMLSNRWPSRLQ